MDADLKGLQAYYKGKRIPFGRITADDGTPLNSEEAHAIIEWGLENGYKSLNQMPDYNEIKHFINKNNKA